MKYFPVFIDAEHIECLIVGAGEVAARKLELVLKTPAKVTVVSPWVSDTVAKLVKDHQLTLHHRRFEDDDLSGKNLVFIATDDEAVNQHVHDLGHQQKILVNVVDNTPLCKFITPSIVDRSPIIIAMSSGGVAPVLLRYIRQKLESVLPGKISLLGNFSEKFRNTVKHALSSVVYDRLVSPDILELVRRDAEKIYVGKAKSNHTIPQEEINELLAKLALEGNRVVRLKGGDPFIFGRGGEEIETLIQHKVDFQDPHRLN